MTFRRVPAFFSLAALSFSLMGCALSSPEIAAPTATAPQTEMNPIRGTVYGGRQPIVGSRVFLLAANVTGNGSASLSLMKSTQAGAVEDTTTGSPTLNDYYVTTGADGSFTLSGNTCSSGQQVYLYSQGGITNSGGAANPQVGLMAVLGACPSSGSFDSSGYVYMNELTTTTSAYAIAGFATDAVHVSSSGSTLGLSGIANAFANASQLNNVHSSAQTALLTTPNGNGTVPQQQINTLANILVACLNSSNSATATTTPCNDLRAYATSDGVQNTPAASGSTNSGFPSDAPTDTASAMINLAHHPYNANIGTLFAQIQSQGAGIFLPDLTSAPADLTVQLLFTGGNLTAANGYNYNGYGTYGFAPPVQPHSLAVDGSGNVWAIGSTQSPISRFTPLGVASSYGSVGDVSENIAIDAASANVYIVNTGESQGSIYKFSIASSTSSAVPLLSTDTDFPVALAIDGSGNLWAADYYNYSTSVIAEASSSGTSYGTQPLSKTCDIALGSGSAGSAWFSNGSSLSVSSNGGSTSGPGALTSYTSNGEGLALTNAIDSSGMIWTGNADSTVSKVTTAGVATQYQGTGTASTSAHYISSIAIDGNNNVWIAGQTDGTIQELNNSGVKQGPTAGFAALQQGSTAVQPQSLAIDGSGDVWYNSNSDGGLREIIGSAIPVATPLAYAVANNKLGQRP